MDMTHFKNKFYGGTRSNRFVVNGAIQSGPSETGIDQPFHIRATFIPPITNITLTLNAFGRKLNVPGDREYSPWQITIYDDFKKDGGNGGYNSNLWSQFSKWHDDINSHELNTSANNTGTNYLSYKQNWNVSHLDLNGNTIKKFKMIGCWPKTVSDIDFNMSRRNFLNTFSVIMLYDSIEILPDGENSFATDPVPE